MTMMTDDHDAASSRRDGAAADKREASECFEHKNCCRRAYLKIFDALKCRWDGD